MKRERKKEVNNVWDKLLELYRATAINMAVGNLISPLLKNKDYLDKVTDKEKLKALCIHLFNDLKYMNTTLNEIYLYHKDKTGTFKDSDELMQSIQLGQLYVNWNVKFQRVIIPQINDILELFGFDKNNMDETLINIQNLIGQPVIKNFQNHLNNQGLGAISNLMDNKACDVSVRLDSGI